MVTANATEQLQRTAIKALEGISSLTLQSVDIIKEQSPLLVKEILTYKSLEVILSIVTSIVVCGIIFFVCKLLRKKFQTWKEEANTSDKMDFFAFMQFICWFLYMILIPLVFITSLSAKLLVIGKIVLAPRLYLFEFFAGLLKSIQ